MFTTDPWRIFVRTSCHVYCISCRERGQPYFLYIALAHMHVPLAPPPPAARQAGDSEAYAGSLREMDALIGAVKSVSDDTDRNNTLIWFTG